jgi:hypothetical protein
VQRAHLQHALAHLPPPNPYREPRAQQQNWRLSG